MIALIIEPDGDDPDCAEVSLEGTVDGRPVRFILDTGAAQTQILGEDEPASGSRSFIDPDERSMGVFSAVGRSALTTVEVAVGPLVIDQLAVRRVATSESGHNLLGMDVLSQHRCMFSFTDATLAIAERSAASGDHQLYLDPRGHAYVGLSWDELTADACWDTGSGITVVDERFFKRHRDLFSEPTSSHGTDVTGTTRETPTFTIAGPTIGGLRFPAHRVAVVDLSHLNATVARRMDFILGYTTLCQADWLMDFPARRWSVALRVP